MIAQNNLILKSLFFSFLINFSSLLIYINLDGETDLLLSEHDEYLYLQESLEMGGLDVPHIKILTSPEGHKDPRVDGQPHSLVKKFFGFLGYRLGLTVITFNLLLDLIFSGISFFVFNLLFRALFDYSIKNEKSFFSVYDLYTSIFICLPWLINPFSYIDLKLMIPLENESAIQFFGLYPLYYPCVPVLRSINTQASYPLFGLAILFLLSNQRKKYLTLALSGLISGILLYVYIFPWMLSFVLGITYLITYSVWNNDYPKIRCKRMCIYILTFLVTSFPGLLMLYSNSLKDTYKIPSEVPIYIFLSPVIFTLILISFSLIKKFKTPSLFLFISILFSTLVVMNIQPVTQKLLTPYHFILFYIYPFLSVYLAVFILYHLRKNVFFKKIICLVFISLIFFKTGDEYFKKVNLVEINRSDTELIQYLKEFNEQDSYFAIFPYAEISDSWWSVYPSWRTTPFYFQLISGKALFPFNYEYFSPEELLYVNYITYYLFRGDEAVLNSCDYEGIYYPDFAYGIVSFEAIRRRELCKEHKEKLPTLLSKNLLTLPIKFLITEPQLYPELYDHVKDNHKEIWRSSDNRYIIFRIESNNIQGE
jgi:hypothetical protein